MLCFVLWNNNGFRKDPLALNPYFLLKPLTFRSAIFFLVDMISLMEAQYLCGCTCKEIIPWCGDSFLFCRCPIRLAISLSFNCMTESSHWLDSFLPSSPFLVPWRCCYASNHCNFISLCLTVCSWPSHLKSEFSGAAWFWWWRCIIILPQLICS